MKKWAEEREKPSCLDQKVQKLDWLLKLKRTSSDDLKNFIVSSKCLDLEYWGDCKYFSFVESCPMGKSFSEIVGKCCKYPDFGFTMWLCNWLYFSQDCIIGNKIWGGTYSCGSTKRGKHLREDLCLLRMIYAVDLICFLSKKWEKEITCVDPVTKNQLLTTVLGLSILLTSMLHKVVFLYPVNLRLLFYVVVDPMKLTNCS